ncbi:hypothetical protein Misp04_14020 [Micromonospora sp. NBRC 101691]|nr:hypothetical protein Misp04_14020 [Micromonospora sp. NBRC 101691]
MGRDEYADRLAEIAQELVVRVRDDDPEANLRWLTNTLRTHDERVHLLFVLAAAVPDDRPWHLLTAWTVLGTGRPAGLLAERYGPLDDIEAELPAAAAA